MYRYSFSECNLQVIVIKLHNMRKRGTNNHGLACRSYCFRERGDYGSDVGNLVRSVEMKWKR